ncbi:hypothetical protein LSTR_LSTR011404 [Laodelphax striatellus]|uniref:Uncharacterized protein n=1 Tax=Laodelphax striatellus TaxID=195883 RepID=A0A482WVL9_LAOST|nr:hypothetical protein LSTR_LSTR011404 [Laodelphax striatellus]
MRERKEDRRVETLELQEQPEDFNVPNLEKPTSNSRLGKPSHTSKSRLAKIERAQLQIYFAAANESNEALAYTTEAVSNESSQRSNGRGLRAEGLRRLEKFNFLPLPQRALPGSTSILFRFFEQTSQAPKPGLLLSLVRLKGYISRRGQRRG